MKLWLLRPQENLRKNDDPWEPWYDKAFGFVVRAETEQEARQIAHNNAGDENERWHGLFTSNARRESIQPWLSDKYSSCVELLPDGEPGIILVDFAHA